MYFEQPQLAQWDSVKNNWKLDAFTDSQYNEGTLFNTIIPVFFSKLKSIVLLLKIIRSLLLARAFQKNVY